MYGMIAPLFRNQKHLRRSMMSALVFSASIFTLTQIVFHLCFSINTAQQIGFPLYQVSRLVQFESFFQRIDPFFFFIFATIISLGLSMGLYSSALSFAQAIGAPDFRPYLFPLAFIALAIAYLPLRLLDTIQLSLFLNIWLTLPLLVIPLLLLLWNRLFSRVQVKK
ncbi:spore germination protein [Heliophilum fasciatum]|uniref:Spore germination protein n=1 Tax=Heliophilum fasciatum TaxID=35700 RepID=A0A4R2RBQ6_9FIRM|nr:magnesium-transporting ATPase (P-type) [Heliophilum fasciatum]TCP60770.1 spore germination protein [Heliophilum fasciatum]